MRRRRRELARVRSDRAPRNRPNSEWGVHGDETGERAGSRRAIPYVSRVPNCGFFNGCTRTVLSLLDSSMRHVKLHYCCGVHLRPTHPGTTMHGLCVPMVHSRASSEMVAQPAPRLHPGAPVV